MTAAVVSLNNSSCSSDKTAMLTESRPTHREMFSRIPFVIVTKFAFNPIIALRKIWLFKLYHIMLVVSLILFEGEIEPYLIIKSAENGNSITNMKKKSSIIVGQAQCV